MKLNISLYRNDTVQFEQCLRPRTPKRQYRQIGAGQAGPGATYRIYLAVSKGKAPPWVTFLQGHTEEGALDAVENLTHAAIILLQVQTPDGHRFFAVSHGYGHLLVDRERIELGFGLKTALNAVDPDRLNLMDSRNVEMQTRQKRVASSANATLGGLDFEIDTEILRIVGGQCVDSSLGLRIDGSDSVHVTVKDLSFEDLGEKCRALYETYRKETYKAQFAFIDHVGLVKGNGLVQALEERLAAALQAEQNDAKIALVCPDQIEQRDCTWYEISGLRGLAPVRAELALPVVHDYLRAVRLGHGVEREHLRRVKILGFDEDGAPRGSQESLLAYLVFETEHDGKRYVLSNEKWYHVDDAYLQNIEAGLDALPRCSNPMPLPWVQVQRKGKWMHHEEDYNKQYAQDSDFLVLDRESFRKFARKYGNSQVEIADLFHLPTRKLLCVKRWNRSRTMSHLLSQASVSAQLLRNLPVYREELIEQIRKKWPRHPLPPDPKEYLQGVSFVFVIGVEPSSAGSLDGLPVFSKVNMVKHVRLIEGAGFNVEVAWAPMVPAARSIRLANALGRRRVRGAPASGGGAGAGPGALSAPP